MASNLKVDIVKPTATNGSLSLKGDSGGSATSNGISVDSSGDTSITGTTTIATADINGGTIDGTTIGASSAAAGTFSSVTATTADINGGTIDGTTIGDTTPAAGSFSSAVVEANSSSDAVRITQTGTGNALVVEDSANPDSTPFVVDASGGVGIGTDLPRIRIDTRYDAATQYSSTISNIYSSSTRDGVSIYNTNTSLADVFASLHFQAEGSSGISAGRIILGNNTSGDGFFSFQMRSSSHLNDTEEKIRIDSSGNLKFDSGYGSVATAYGCRAWIVFNGQSVTSSADMTGVDESGNVDSLEDQGTGQYKINFSNNMPDANYVVVGSSDGGGTTQGVVSVDNTFTNYVEILVRDMDDDGFTDRGYVSVAVIR